jgi:hypothetical protein
MSVNPHLVPIFGEKHMIINKLSRHAAEVQALSLTPDIAASPGHVAVSLTAF